MKSYRIGELVKETGITQDTLKFYEKQGMINSNRNESGYRFYNVPDCGDILQILYYRKLGFSVKEIADVFGNSKPNEIIKALEEKIEETEKSIGIMKRKKRALEDYNELCSHIAYKPNTWKISYCHDYYYLKHTTADNFIKDRYIGKYIKSWVDELIEMNLSMLIPKENIYLKNIDDCYWGFSVSTEIAKRLGILTDRPVQRIHLGKCFIYNFSQERREDDNQRILDRPLEIINQLGYSLSGDVLCNYIFQITNGNKKEERVDNYIIMIPIC